jgi:hypothetical protein
MSLNLSTTKVSDQMIIKKEWNKLKTFNTITFCK